MSDGRHQHPHAAPDDLASLSRLEREDHLQTSRASLLFHVPVSLLSPDEARHTFDHENEDEDARRDGDTYSQNPSVRRWRKATIALNATRRFRYTAQSSRRVNRIRTAALALRAARRFQQSIATSPVNGYGHSHSYGSYPYSVGQVELQSLGNAGGEFTIHRMEASPSNVVMGTAELSLRAKLSQIVQYRDPEYLADLGGVEGVSKLLNVDLERGLDDDPVLIQKMRDEFGSNSYPEQPSKSFFSFVLDACRDPTLIILIVCAVLSLAFGMKSHGPKEGWYDGTSILFAVILVVLVTSVSDYRQSLQFKVLNDEKKNIMIDVIRGGRRIKISIFDLVVGDLVSLNIGDQVPADGLFVGGHSLSIDESSMTGESEPVTVDSRSPYLMSGCKVADGYGTMLVTGVGMETEWGKVMAIVGEDLGEETPLQKRLNDVATFVGQIGLAVALLVFIILIIFYFTGRTNGSGNSGKFKAHQTSASDAINSVVDIFAIAVTIVVVAVPEGLPLAVTLSLAYAMRKMMADRALVRRLSACETMGSATVICTDKTGTLTTNVMTVTKVWLEEELMDADHVNEIDDDLQMLLFEGIAQNSSASVFVTPEGQAEVVGSPTEKAVLVFGLNLGMNFQLARSRTKILQVETFNSAKKKAGVAIQRENGRVLVHWKGAAEIILESCDTVLGAGGSKHSITDLQREELLRIIEAMASQSLRCIALGYMEMRTEDVPIGEQLEVWKIPEGPLTLLAILGMKDPSRPGVREAVEKCKKAKVKVIMLTGDNLITAKAIATEVGILWKEEQLAIEGYTFRNYSDEEREDKIPRISVIARTTPTDKYLMVNTLKKMGEVVAVTGDGTNDAPALHDADIGLAMGIQGTEVAKESSDIIILDDNFATVVKVLRWGRSIYVNIQKFIQFQLTVNVAALTINFVAAVSTGNVPLTAVQLLWVNLIMDTLGALALATEPPSDELLKRAPVGRTEPLVTNVIARNLLLQAAYQVTVLLTLQFRGKQILRLQNSTKATDINNTVIFNSFVFCQLFNEVNARRPEEKNIFRGIFNNMLFLGIIASTAILQVIIVEFLNKFASTVKLSWQYWLVSIGIGLLSWPIAFIGKFIPVPKKPIMQFRLKPCGGRSESHEGNDEE